MVSDCKEASRLIQDPGIYLGPKCFLLDEVKSLLVIHSDCNCIYASRISNRATHALARFSHSVDSYVIWMEVGTDQLNLIL